MSRPIARRLAYAGLALLYLLHNDLWLWNDPRLVLGLPIGFVYHIGYCVAASLLMLLLVLRAWPAGLAAEDLQEDDR